MLEPVIRWLRRRRVVREEPEMAVPKEVRDASHGLANAIQRANYQIIRAEQQVTPIEALLLQLRRDE